MWFGEDTVVVEVCGVMTRWILLFTCLSLGANAWAMPKAFSRWELHQRGTIADYNQGITGLSGGDLERAKEAFESVVAGEPRAAVGWYGLAVVELRLRRVDEAVAILEHVATSYPRADVSAQLSKAYFTNQDFEKARHWGKLAVAISPDSVEGQSVYQWALMRLGEYEAALESINAVRETNPSGDWDCLEIRLWVEQGEYARAKPLTTGCYTATYPELARGVLARLGDQGGSSVDSGQGVSATREVKEAITLIRANRFQEGIDRLNGVLTLFPDHATARIIRGTAFYLQRDFEKAREDLQSVFEAQTWVDVESDGVMTGILTQAGEAAFKEQIRQGIGILALLYIELGDKASAASVIARAGAEGHEGIELEAAAAALSWHRDERDTAWVELERLLLAEAGNRFVLRIISDLAHRDSDSVPASLRSRLSEQGSWKQNYNLAAGQSNAGQFEECGKTAMAALARFEHVPEARDLLSDVAYGCVLSLGDLEQAAALHSQYGAAYLLEENRLRHATLLVNASRADEALRLLEHVKGAYPTLTSIQVAARLDSGDLDGAVKWAQGEEDVELTYELSFELVRAERWAESVRLLERACPILANEECPKLLAIAKAEDPSAVE
jgi:tetratricopeptide (TPR) repeat protein